MTDVMDRPIARPLWRTRRAAVVMGGAVLAVLVAVSVLLAATAHRTVRVPAQSLSVGQVQEDVFHDFIPLNAKVVPRDMVYLDALEGGQVAQILIQPGDKVGANQPMIVFRNTALELDVLDRVGRLVESITQLQTYEKSLEQNHADNEKELAQIEYNITRLSRLRARREQLAAKGYLPLESRDETRDELALNMRLQPLQVQTNRTQDALRLKQLPQVRSELSTLQQSLVVTRSKLDSLVVRAPVAGRVTAMDLKVGQNRNRGERLAEITADTGFKVSADVDEFYLSRVHPGQVAEADFNGTTRQLSVTRVYPQVKDGRFTVDLAFVGQSPTDLTPGQSVQGKLALGGDRRGLVLPAGPFVDRTAGRWVFVVSGDGRSAERRAIQIGRRNIEQIEVLRGLNPGEKVITSEYSGFDKIDRILIDK